jgi:hypothetical protein
MKRIILTALILMGINQIAKLQNTLYVTIDSGLCLDELTITYTDASSEIIQLGCTNSYQFDIGDRIMDHATINSVDCPLDQTTDVIVNDSKPAKAKPKIIPITTTNMDSIITLIR